MSAAAATILLIRHGDTDAVGVRLTGRSSGVHLNAAGRAQAARIPARLSTLTLAAVYSSPLERARETAEPLATARALRVQVRDDLNEMDFGTWSGAAFTDLAGCPEWARFNAQRSRAGAPGGETAAEVQARITRALETLRTQHPSETVAIVTHADVIRSAVLHCAGAPLDFIHRFEIAPASITTLILGEGEPLVAALNERDRV